jgi:hypothetical protein
VALYKLRCRQRRWKVEVFWQAHEQRTSGIPLQGFSGNPWGKRRHREGTCARGIDNLGNSSAFHTSGFVIRITYRIAESHRMNRRPRPEVQVSPTVHHRMNWLHVGQSDASVHAAPTKGTLKPRETQRAAVSTTRSPT